MDNRLNDDKKQLIGHIMACLTQFMWGATFVFTKILLKYFIPTEVLFIRVVLAMLVLFLIWPHKLKLKFKKDELLFAAAGLTGIVMYYMLENTALTMTNASTVGIIVACAPFFVAVIVGLIFKSERLKKTFFIGFVISIAGIALVSINGDESGGFSLAGTLLAVIATVAWGFYSAVVKKISERNYNPIGATRKTYCYAALFLIPILLIQHHRFDVNALMDMEVLFNFFFLAIGASALGFCLWNLATKWIGAIKTSVYIYISPIVTLILSVIILKEKLTVASFVGIILIFIGLITAQDFMKFKKKENR